MKKEKTIEKKEIKEVKDEAGNYLGDQMMLDLGIVVNKYIGILSVLEIIGALAATQQQYLRYHIESLNSLAFDNDRDVV